ncbi:MAG: hypothetical protein B6D61_00975 [Bacteroidetes bacterium 4484_249]|nr:MAG: hypothetical protein B6D61_00975 [Bacteroidetes bacterium 4484_249]
MKKCTIIFCGLLLILSQKANSQQEGFMLNIKVETASKKAQTISEAPAIVSVITPEQIEELGVQTLTELMTYIPGFSVADSYWKRQIVTARGVKMTLYNDKILMLINGIPAYDAAAMEHYLDVMPINAIKRIEIIRGPGSTLYGTNAFSAVINIITKDGEENEGVDAYVKGGSFGTREIGTSFGGSKNDFSYFVSGTIKDNDGYLKEDVVDEYGKTGSILYEHDNSNFFTNLKYKDFSINSGYLYQKWAKFGPLPAFIYGNNNSLGAGGRAHQQKFYFNAIFDKNINDKLSTKISVHYDWMDKQTDIGLFGVNIYQNALNLIDTTVAPDYYRFGGSLIEGEAQIGYTFNDYISIIGGISAESRKTKNLADLYTDFNGDRLFEGATQELPFSVNDFGGYLQADGNFGKIAYVAGIRLSYLGISKEVYLTPRAGLVYNISKTSSVKALYGEAFRGAGPQEQYYKVPYLIYGLDAVNRGLKPERIRTYELAWDQSITEKYMFRINGYMLDVFDMINRREATQEELDIIDPNMTSTKIYDNLGEQKINGVEVEIKGYPSDVFSFFANFSYKDGQVDDDAAIYYNRNVIFNPADTSVTLEGGDKFDKIPSMENITANAGISFKFGKLAISPNFQYVGKKEGFIYVKKVYKQDIYGDKAAKYTIDSLVTVDPFGLLNLVVSYQFNNNINLSLSARNLLNAEYFYPEDVRKNLATIPGGPGISFFFKLSYNLFGKD